MKLGRNIILAITCALAVCFLATAFWMRGSITHFVMTDDSLAGLNAAPGGEGQSLDGLPPGFDFAMLRESSDLVARVGNPRNHTVYDMGVLTEVTVKEVYKGDQALAGESVYIHEPSSVNPYGQHPSVLVNGGYLFMQEGGEYIVFLTFYEQPEGYAYTARDRATYLLTAQQFGKYPLELNLPETVDYGETAGALTYGEIAQYSLFTQEKGTVALFQKLYEDVAAHYLAA